MGKVFPTEQKVSVNGGEAQKLIAYNRGGFNYIKIRDLARLLNGTSSQFDVEYDETVGIRLTKMIQMKLRRLKPPDKKPPEHIHFVVTVKMCVSEE